MVILLDAEKAFNKIHVTSMIKVLEGLEIQGTGLNMIKAIHCKHIANINLNGDKFKVFPLKSTMRQGCLLSPFIFNIVLEVLTRAIRRLKEIKQIPIEKEELKVPLLTDGMIVYISDTKNSTRNP